MFNAEIFLIFVIAQILFMLATGWNIIFKGRRIVENFWLFLFLFFQQLLSVASVVNYFPFYSSFFFSTYLALINFAILFVYAFPRSVKIKKWWVWLILFGDIMFLSFFHASDNFRPFVYLVSSIFFMSLGLWFSVKKLKYIKKNRRLSILLVTLATTLQASAIGVMSSAAIFSYNVYHFKWFISICFPLYYIFLLYLLAKKVESGTNISSFLMQIFFILSAPLAFLFKELSSIRVSILSFFSVDNFFVPAAVLSFIFLNFAALLILYLGLIMNDYFNMKHLYFQKLITKFRAQMQNLTTYDALFNYYDLFMRNSFKEIKDIRYLSDSEEERILSKVTLFPIGTYPASGIFLWFERSKEPFLLKNSVEFPANLSEDFAAFGCDIMLPVHGRNTIIGAILIEAKSIKMPAANCIATITSIMTHNIMRIALFESIVENEKKLQQQRHFSEVDKMVSIIAHEIRTPLTSIMFNIELIAESLKNVPEVDGEFIDITTKEIKRLNESVQKMLSYGRNIRLEPIAGAFPQFIEELRFLYAASPVKIDFQNNVAETLKIDWNALKQVVVNLINNAIQAIEKSGKGSKIIVSITADTKVRISVADNGPGIPAEAVNSIFEPFFTTRKDGNGLGLAICEKIIKIMGGRIRLKETGAAGTTFTISIPVDGVNN